jgi:hypothetical protein
MSRISLLLFCLINSPASIAYKPLPLPHLSLSLLYRVLQNNNLNTQCLLKHTPSLCMAVPVGFVLRKAFDHVAMRQKNGVDSTCAVEARAPVIKKHYSCLLVVRKDTKVREEVFCSGKVRQQFRFWRPEREQIMRVTADVFLAACRHVRELSDILLQKSWREDWKESSGGAERYLYPLHRFSRLDKAIMITGDSFDPDSINLETGAKDELIVKSSGTLEPQTLEVILLVWVQLNPRRKV